LSIKERISEAIAAAYEELGLLDDADEWQDSDVADEIKLVTDEVYEVFTDTVDEDTDDTYDVEADDEV